MFDKESMARAQELAQRGKNAGFLGLGIVSIIAVPLEVFLHRGFGARYFGKMKWLAIGGIIVAFWNRSWVVDSIAAGNLMLAFFLAAALALCGHLIAAEIQRRRGIMEQSRFMGVPWPIWNRLPISRNTVMRFVEPVLVFFVALPIGGAGIPEAGFLASGIALMLFLLCASMGLAVKMNFILSRHAAAVQDGIDAQLQGQYYNQEVEQRVAEERAPRAQPLPHQVVRPHPEEPGETGTELEQRQ